MNKILLLLVVMMVYNKMKNYSLVVLVIAVKTAEEMTNKRK